MAQRQHPSGLADLLEEALVQPGDVYVEGVALDRRGRW